MANPRYNKQTTPSIMQDDGWETKGINVYTYGKGNGAGAYDRTGSGGHPAHGGKGSKATFSRKGKRGQEFSEEFKKKGK